MLLYYIMLYYIMLYYTTYSDPNTVTQLKQCSDAYKEAAIHDLNGTLRRALYFPPQSSPSGGSKCVNLVFITANHRLLSAQSTLASENQITGPTLRSSFASFASHREFRTQPPINNGNVET